MNFRDTNKKNKTRAISLARLISVAVLSIRENHWRLRAVKTDPDRDNSPSDFRFRRGIREAKVSANLGQSHSLVRSLSADLSSRAAAVVATATLSLSFSRLSTLMRFNAFDRSAGPANRAVNAFPAQILFPGETLAER